MCQPHPSFTSSIKHWTLGSKLIHKGCLRNVILAMGNAIYEGTRGTRRKKLKRAYVIACDHLSLCKRTEKESTSQKLNSSLCR
jgi:hypothetical protein